MRIIIFLAVLVLTVGGSYLYILPKFKTTPPVQETPLLKVTTTATNDSSLSVYNDQQLGFEFKYQKQDITIQNDTEEEYSKRGLGDFRKNFTGYVGYEPPKLIKAVAALGKDSSFDLSPFTVWVFENPKALNDAAWYDKYWYYPFMWGIFAREHKYMSSVLRQATISGQQIEYRLLGYQDGAPQYLYFPHKGNMILVRVLTDKNNGEQILTTFKLIN